MQQVQENESNIGYAGYQKLLRLKERDEGREGPLEIACL